MSTFFQVLLIGILATVAMTGVLSIMLGNSLSSADMFRALGSIATKKQDLTLGAGILMHLIVGCVSAFIYVAVWSTFSFDGLREFIIVGALVGFAHGFLMSFILIVNVAEHHKLARFRKVGFGVAIAFLVAHIVYGTVVGYGAGMFETRFAALEKWAMKSESSLY